MSRPGGSVGARHGTALAEAPRPESGAATQQRTRGTLVTASLVAGAVAIVAQSVTHLVATVGFGVCDGAGAAHCQSVYDLDHNNGISDILSTVVIGAAAFGAFALGAARRPRGRTAFALGALLVLVLFADALHLEDTLADASGLIVLATIACTAILTIRVAAGVSPGARLLVLIGVAVLALDVKAPYVYDQLMNIIGQPYVGRGDVLYELGIVLDEGLELAGWTLLAVGLWDAALSPRVVDPGRGRRAEDRMRVVR